MIMPQGKDSASLKEAVDKALAELRKEGKLKEISEKYFGMDITSEK
jgi:cystine transport system substrate-binding protein